MNATNRPPYPPRAAPVAQGRTSFPAATPIQGDLAGIEAQLGAAAASLSTSSPARGPSTAPPDEGVKLATIDRSETEQLRVRWSTYQNAKFLSIRVWTKGSDGGWWPSKKGISIKPRELGEFAKGVLAAIQQAKSMPPRSEPTSQPQQPRQGQWGRR